MWMSEQKGKDMPACLLPNSETASALTEAGVREMAPRNHMVGWIAVAGRQDRDEMREKIDAGLDSFDGDYGQFRERRCADGFGFGLRRPRNPLPLTTWSLFEEKGKICFIEGVFYADYLSHRPAEGEDRELAAILLRQFNETGKGAFAQLNGTFSGFVFDHATGRLVTFVDRLGVHVLSWYREKCNVVVSSDIAAFRGLKNLSIDRTAAFQYLTIGFPVDERTLLKDVMMQLPGTMNIFDDRSSEAVRYWDVPERMRKVPLSESVEHITLSMEDHVDRIFQRTQHKGGLGLTGGHDSRVILSALSYKKIPFDALSWRDYNFNERVAAELCSVVGKRPVITPEISDAEREIIGGDIFTYSSGYYLHSHGFTRLAKECFRQRGNHLFLGFSGDRISGALTIPAPQYLRSVEQLAACTLKNQMELLSFRDARLLLKNANEEVIEETRSEWLRSFTRLSALSHLADISIWQGISNRNLKRIRFSMVPAKQYVQPIFPYLDTEILAAYMSMPVAHLNNQKAHCYAGFRRFRDFGNYRACSYPITLKREASFPPALYAARLFRQTIKDLLSAFRSEGYKGAWNRGHNKIFEELCRSPFFDHHVVRELFLGKKVQPRGLHKMQTLSRFYDYYVLGKSRQDYDAG